MENSQAVLDNLQRGNPKKNYYWFLGAVILFGAGSLLGFSLANQTRTQSSVPSSISQTQPTPIKPFIPTNPFWSTYADLRYSFFYQYPAELYEYRGDLFTTPQKEINPWSESKIFGVTIETKTYYNEVKDFDFTDQIGTKKEIADKTFGTITKVFELDSRPALQITIEVLPESQTDLRSGSFVIVDMGKNVLTISYPLNANQLLKPYNVTFEDILSTFKFIN